ncbi:transmembrane protein 179-like [Styela clava]|uniref:transmembrane protein 179B-like n=1 Tax=Styela clava TaxID=7725 RepID=UPI00193AB946|nr:transmembrane protein 179B-like [Styela clava]
MAKIDWIVGTSTIIYFATAITEIVSSVPVGLTQDDFGNNCILSASMTYFYHNTTMVVKQFGSPGACGFCTYLTTVTVLYALGYGCYSAYALYKSVENAQHMWVLPAIMACSLLCILKFISSCVLSVGFSQFCKAVVDGTYIKNCQGGQDADWFYGTTALTSSNYYAYMTTAQSASWFCVFEWFLLAGLGFLHYRRNIALRSYGRFDQGFGSSDTQGIVSGDALPGNVQA